MPVENPVISFLNKMTDLVVLNLLFVLCCIPIVTIGPALTAMYYVNLRSVRYGDGYVISNFFRSFRQNFKQSFVAGMLSLLLVLVFSADLLFWLQNDFGILSTVMTVVSGCFAFLCGIVLLWLFPLIAKTQNVFRVHLKNAAAMAVGHFFPYTVVCVAIVGATFYLAYTSLVADLLLLIIGFALVTYLLSFFFYKVFAKYMEEEPIGEDDPLYGKAQRAEKGGAESKQAGK